MRRQTGWSQESNLLYEISKKIERLSQITASSGGGAGGGSVYDLLDNTSSNKTFALTEDGVTKTTISLESFSTFTDLYTGNAILRGGVIYDSILDQYYVWATAYIIDGVFYNTPIDGYVTLPNGDVTFDRVVLFKIVNDGTNPPSVGFDLGPADGTLLEPSLDLSQEVEVGFKILIANETVPTEITDILIYDENVGGPTEYNITIAPAGGNPADPTLPYNGAVSHLIPAANVSLQFTGTSTITIVPTTKLVLALKTSTAWSGQSRLRISIENTGTGETSNILSLNRNNMLNHNFVHTNIGAWQIVSIDISEFQNFNTTTLDRVTFSFIALNSMQMDRVFIQNGIQSTNNPPSIDIAPIPNEYANLAALIVGQGSQLTNYIYEVTDGSGFTGIDSGIVWAKYKGTTTGTEADYSWEPRGGASPPVYNTGNTVVFTERADYNLSNLPNIGQAVTLDGTGIVDDTPIGFFVHAKTAPTLSGLDIFLQSGIFISDVPCLYWILSQNGNAIVNIQTETRTQLGQSVLTASSVDNTENLLNWTSVANANNYILYGSTTNDLSTTSVLYNGALLTFSHTGLTENNIWYYWLVACHTSFTYARSKYATDFQIVITETTLLSDDFADASLDTAKWDEITDTNVTQLETGGVYQFSDNSTQGTGPNDASLRSDNQYDGSNMVVLKADLTKNVQNNATFYMRFRNVDTGLDYVSIQSNVTSDAVELRTFTDGSQTGLNIYALTGGMSNSFKIIISGTNAYAYAWSGTEWILFGTSAVPSQSWNVSFGREGLAVAGNIYTVDNVYVTNHDFDTLNP